MHPYITSVTQDPFPLFTTICFINIWMRCLHPYLLLDLPGVMEILRHQLMDRTPCFRCGTRSDIGCAHVEKTPVEYTTVAFRDNLSEIAAAHDAEVKTESCHLCAMKFRPLGLAAHMWRAHRRGS